MNFAKLFNNPFFKPATAAVKNKGIKFIVIDTSGDVWKPGAFTTKKHLINESTLEKIKELNVDIYNEIIETNKYGESKPE